MSLKFVQTQAITLLTGLSIAGTSAVVTPYPRDIQTNTKLVFADFGTTPTITIDPKISGYEEICSFTGITDNGDGTATLTGLTRNLIGQYPYTTAGTGKQHGPSAVVVFSDNPQMYARLGALENDQTWTGKNYVPTPTDPTQIANKAYVDSVSQSGATDASTTVKGVARLSASPNGTPTALTSISNASPAVFTLTSHGLTLNDSIVLTTTGSLPTGLALATTYYVISAGLTANAFEVSATLGGTAVNTSTNGSGTHSFTKTTPVAVGVNDVKVSPVDLSSLTTGRVAALAGDNTDVAVGAGNLYVTQTGLQHNAEKYAADAGANDTYVITLSPAPISYTNGMIVYFKANTVNTGPATININGLGAKTIVKYVNTTLDDGDIAAGMFCTLIYDGTNFVLQNPIANVYERVLYKSYTTISTNNGNTTENNLLTLSIPANTLGTSRAIRLRYRGNYALNPGGNGPTIRTKYGSTTVSTIATAQNASSNTMQFAMEVIIYATGATNTQKTISSFHSIINSTGAPATQVAGNADSQTSAEDSTTTLNLILTSQYGSTSNASVLNITDYTVEILN